MSRHSDLTQVLDRGAVAIIRAPSGELLVDVSKALYAGGLDVIEVTFTVPGVLEIISPKSSRNWVTRFCWAPVLFSILKQRVPRFLLVLSL